MASGSPAALAATVRRFSHSTGIVGRSARIALAAVLRTGAVKLLPGADFAVVAADGAGQAETASVLTTLDEIFGTKVAIGISVGAVRANRKPVLHVLAPDGHTLGFAKLALSPLAASLLRAEAANLRLLARHPFQHIELPQVIHEGTWETHELLVMTALHTPARRRHAAADLPVRAMAELAAFGGISSLSLSDSAWFADIAAAAETPEPGARRFGTLLDRLVRRYGDEPIEFGSWHGDWGPWNMAWAGDRVRLWDWERFALGVPYGLDALHYSLPVRPETAERSTLEESAARALAPFPAAGRSSDLLLRLYVVALCARFLPDSLTEHGAQLRPRVVGLLDLLEALLETGSTRAATARRPAAIGSQASEVSR